MEYVRWLIKRDGLFQHLLLGLPTSILRFKLFPFKLQTDNWRKRTSLTSIIVISVTLSLFCYSFAISIKLIKPACAFCQKCPTGFTNPAIIIWFDANDSALMFI
jgi:hypothetical protein